MNITTSLGALIAAPLILLAACGSDPESDPQRPTAPIPGGGTSGGTIQRELTVFAHDEAGQPIAGAAVLVEAGELKLEAKTDEEGRADLEHDELRGPIALHLFHDGYTARSLIGFDASIITVPLSGRGASRIPVATAVGTVGGWEQMPALGPASAQVAFIEAAGRGDIAAVAQNVRPGTISRSNPEGIHTDVLLQGNEMFPTFDRFTLHFDAQATTLVARAGTLTVDPFGPPVMELTHLGFQRGVQAVAGSTLTTSIQIAHALDQQLEARFSGAPELPVSRGTVALELPEGGERVYLPGSVVRNARFTAKVPVLSGALSGGAYLAIGTVMANTTTAGELPAQEAIAYSRGDRLSLEVQGFLPLPGAPSAGGRTLSAAPSPSATQHVYSVFLGNETAWTITLAGDDHGSVVLPEAPKGVQDPLNGQMELEVRAVAMPGVKLDEARFAELPEHVTAASIHRASVTF